MNLFPGTWLTGLTTGVTLCLCSLLLVLLEVDTLRAQGSMNLYQRAPDVIPGTLPEMRTPSFWIDRVELPDEPVLTTDRIKTVNREYRTIIDGLLDEANTSDLSAGVRRQLASTPGLIAYRPDADSFSPTDCRCTQYCGETDSQPERPTVRECARYSVCHTRTR